MPLQSFCVCRCGHLPPPLLPSLPCMTLVFFVYGRVLKHAHFPRCDRLVKKKSNEACIFEFYGEEGGGTTVLPNVVKASYKILDLHLSVLHGRFLVIFNWWDPVIIDDHSGEYQVLVVINTADGDWHVHIY